MLGWLFALGVILHNIEEALFLPGWSARNRRRQFEVNAASFRFAVTLLSLAVLAAASLASSGGSGSFGAYFLAGYALAMVLNVFIPHLAASIVLREYAPGTATALLFNLPLGSWYVYRSLTEDYVNPGVFLYSGPLTVLAIAASIPILLAVRNRLAYPSGGTH